MRGPPRRLAIEKSIFRLFRVSNQIGLRCSNAGDRLVFGQSG